MSGIYTLELHCIYRKILVAPTLRTGIPSIQNTNLVSHCLIYTFEREINLLDCNPAYPKEPKTLGERIRKARMDKGLMIKELARILGVTEATVINWEVRGRKPMGRNIERMRKFLDNIKV